MRSGPYVFIIGLTKWIIKGNYVQIQKIIKTHLGSLNSKVLPGLNLVYVPLNLKAASHNDVGSL